MGAASAQDITRLLQECGAGGTESADRLIALLYDELRSLADGQLRGERAGHTLQPTALVHEAFLRLVGSADRKWESRRHFFCAAATAMRRILVNHALARKTLKRGGQQSRVPLDDAVALLEERSSDLVALDEALQRLAVIDAEKSRLVELRFFVGLSAEETAEVLDLSTRTIERHWRVAKAWLLKELDAA